MLAGGSRPPHSSSYYRVDIGAGIRYIYRPAEITVANKRQNVIRMPASQPLCDPPTARPALTAAATSSTFVLYFFYSSRTPWARLLNLTDFKESKNKRNWWVSKTKKKSFDVV